MATDYIKISQLVNLKRRESFESFDGKALIISNIKLSGNSVQLTFKLDGDLDTNKTHTVTTSAKDIIYYSQELLSANGGNAQFNPPVRAIAKSDIFDSQMACQLSRTASSTINIHEYV